jgi:hypothetical protein
MRAANPLIVTFLIAVLCVCANAGDDKKHMTVRAGRSARQANNHPWSYTTPGHGNTNCSGSGTVNATSTDTGYGTTNTSGTVNADTNCSTTYTPSQTVEGNRVTVENASWVTDVATGDEYLIECTAGWVGSKCSYLTGGSYGADLKGNAMWITGSRGMRQTTAKYKVLRYVPQTRNSATPSPTPVEMASETATIGRPVLSAEEIYARQTYLNLGPEDKDYVRVFCASNPKGAALVPKAKVDAGQVADHSLDCAAWASANNKSQ